MRNIKHLFCRILLLPGIAIIGLIACSNKDGEDPATQEAGATASIQLGDRDPLAMVSSITVAAAAQSNKISMTFTDTENSMMLLISLISTEDKIVAGQKYSLIPGNLEMDGMGSAKLNPVGSSSAIEGGYTTVKDIDGDNKFDGSGTVHITSLTEDHIAGTFAIVMYNDAGEKASIKEGKFNMAIDFAF